MKLELKSDIKRYNLTLLGIIIGWFTGHSFYAVFYYRLSHWLYKLNIKIIPDIVRFHSIKKFGCEISPLAKIGEGFLLHHTLGIVIGWDVVAGKNLEVFQNVTIGSNRRIKDGKSMPIIGDNVSIGAGAVIVGALKIGSNVMIGANSYVDSDIPDNVLVAGVPARIIKQIKST